MALPKQFEEAATRLKEVAYLIDEAREKPLALESLREWLDALTTYATALADIHQASGEQRVDPREAARDLLAHGLEGMVRAMELIVGDRATFEFDGHRLSVEDTVQAAVDGWVRAHLRGVRPGVDLHVRCALAPGSVELSGILRRPGVHLAVHVGDPVDRPLVAVQVLPPPHIALDDVAPAVRAVVAAELARLPALKGELQRGEHAVYEGRDA